MTDNEYVTWTESKLEVFQQWIFAHFVRDGHRGYRARVMHTENQWRHILHETPWMVNQFDGMREFPVSGEALADVGAPGGEYFYVLAEFKKHGEVYMPTEGMEINWKTGKMSYV